MKTLIAVLITTLLLTSCGKIEKYELKRIADRCGGYENIHQVWLDAHVVKAYCVDGTAVRSQTEPL
jgi:hypothetical protein